MATAEKKEKKRKRDKDPEKSAKKQKRESAAAKDATADEDAELARAESKRKRKEKKSKSPEDERVNGVQAVEQSQSIPLSQPEKDTRIQDPSAISPADEKRLQKHSPFVTRTTSLYLPLSPCAARFPVEGLLAEHISTLLLTYYPPLQGVLLSFSNARISETPHPDTDQDRQKGKVLTRCINEYAVTFVWLTADFLLFRPRKGTWMEGHVRLGNESMVGLVCYNYFNAVIERDKMPTGWSWVAEDEEELEEQKGRRRALVESNGFFRDGEGKRVEGRLVFRVEDFEALVGDGGGGVSIMGTLLSEKEGN